MSFVWLGGWESHLGLSAGWRIAASLETTRFLVFSSNGETSVSPTLFTFESHPEIKSFPSDDEKLFMAPQSRYV